MKTITQLKNLVFITLLSLSANFCFGQPSAQEVITDLNNKIGQCIDMDNAYGCQCVDLAKYVCITYWGQNITGNANQLDELNRWPAGTVKINYYSGFIPQPGDFYIWNDYGTNGHIGFITSATSTTYMSLDLNYFNPSSNGSPLASVSHNNYNNFTCVMRLPYSVCPTIPNTITPSSGQTNVGIPVFFNWDDVSGINPIYRIQVSTSNTGWTAANGFTTATSPSGNIKVNYNTQSTSSYSWSQYISTENPFVPQPYTTYYYTVKSFACGQSSNWSTVKSFTTGCAASTPILNTPSNGQTNLTIPVNFDWQDSSASNPEYRIQVSISSNNWTAIDGFTTATTPNPTIRVNENTNSTSSFTWNSSSNYPPQSGVTYYWTVKTFACNHSSEWSPVRSFTIGNSSNCTLSVIANPSVGGLASGVGTFSCGTLRTVNAVPNTGYTFSNWSENGSQISTNSSYTFTLSSDRNLVANFTQNQTSSCLTCPNYDFGNSINSNWSNHSNSIQVNGCRIYRFLAVPGRTYNFKTGCGDGATANFDTFLSLIDYNCATISTNDDGCTTPSNTSSIQWTCNYSSANWIYLKVSGYQTNFGAYTLAYQEITPTSTYTITTSANPSIGGITSGDGNFNNGDSCYVTATANTGYTFVNWTENGGLISTNQNFSFTVSGNRNLVANFTQNQTGSCLTCPNYDFSNSINSTWGNHSSSIQVNGCKIYRFLAVPGRNYTFKTGCGDGATANFDSYLTLLDSNCSIITVNDDGCVSPSNTSIIQWTCNYNSANWIYLKVSGYSVAFGSYTLVYNETQTLNIEDNEILNKKIVVSPNPTNDIITISSNEGKILKIEIVDIQGRLITKENYNSSSIEINLSSYSNGTYFLKASFGEKEETIKIIKN